MKSLKMICYKFNICTRLFQMTLWKNYKEAKHLHQISENNLTTLRYSKITWYSAINQGQILGQFGGYYLTRVIFELGL